ncbi:MAG: TIM-barrel domain-containing protein, partial [Bacteroidaceae bacterium]
MKPVQSIWLTLAAPFLFGQQANAQSVEQLNGTTVQVNLPEGQRMYLDFYGPSIIRVFQDPQGGIIRDPEARPEARILADNPRKAVGTLKVEGNVLITDSIRVKVDAQTGALTIEKDGIPIVEQLGAANFGKKEVSVAFRQSPTDYFYGGGCQNGRFSHKDQVIKIVNDNNWTDGGVASPNPFYWSTRGYGLMWHTFAPGEYDFGRGEEGKTIVSHKTTYVDYFLMVDKGAKALLNDYYQITGQPVLLPKFGFYEGHLNAYNRDYWTESENGFMAYEDGKRYNESQKDNGGIRESLNGEKNNYQFSARAAIDRYLDNDFPLGWFLPNDGYGAGYGQTGTLDGNIQNLKEFGDYARSKGVEIGLWTQSDLHPKEGIEPLLQRDIVKEVRDAGVRVLKTDVAWVGAGYSFGLNGVADVAHIMPYYGGEARPFIITLDGWAGTQRYAGIWTGDQTGGQWEYIRFHIPTYIGCGLSGQPNVSSDMDGIFGGKNTPVNVRDFQWKTFTPMQLNMDGWGSNPKYPQALGEPATSINRWYLKLKSRLMPYTYSIAREAVDGLPIMRAMMLEEQNPYTLGRSTQYQFLYGPSILVAPIYKETRADKDGNDVRDGIYLPKGEWIDYFTGEVYEGGCIFNDYAAPLWKLPILVRRGSIIPTHVSTNTPAEADAHLRIYDLYPGPGIQSFTEYDDDGKTQAYLGGACVTTVIEQAMDAKGQYTLKVSPAKGSYQDYEPAKSTRLRIYCSQEPGKLAVSVKGKKVKLQRVSDYQAWEQTPNSYYYGKENATYMDSEALMIHLAQANVTENDIQVTIKDIQLKQTGHLLQSHGTLQAPSSAITEKARQAYSLMPEWKEVANADYYEIEFQGQRYSNIHQLQYMIEDLVPEQAYEMKIRAVNADGTSDWTTLKTTTKSDPLEHAIHGIKAETTCNNQGGQGVAHLFDFDESSVWHTAWSEKAVPFEMIIDLKSVNVLDKLQYLPRPDAANGTILKLKAAYSMDRSQWTEVGEFTWA